MTATYTVTYPAHTAVIVAGEIVVTPPLRSTVPFIAGIDYTNANFTSGGSVFFTVPTTGTTVTYTAFVSAHSGLTSSNFLNRPYVLQTLTFSTVAPPEIQSFARMDNTSTLQVSPGGNYTLRAVFTNGSGTITSSPGFPGVVSYNLYSGVSYTFGTSDGLDRVLTLTVINAAGTSVSRTLSIDVVPDPVITSFNRGTNDIAPNTNVTLRAFFTGGTGNIMPGNYTVVDGETITVQPSQTTTYTLTVTNTLNVSVTQDRIIDVVSNPVITSFTRSANDIAPNTDVTLTSFFTGGTGRIMPGNYTVANGETITVQPSQTITYTLTVTNTLNVSVTQDRIINVVQPPTPTLNVQPSSVAKGDNFQVQYLVPITASVTVVMTGHGLLFANPADFTVVSSTEDRTSVPGGKRVTTIYDLTVGSLSTFVNRYGYDWIDLEISVQWPGNSISTMLYIDANI